MQGTEAPCGMQKSDGPQSGDESYEFESQAQDQDENEHELKQGTWKEKKKVNHMTLMSTIAHSVLALRCITPPQPLWIYW